MRVKYGLLADGTKESILTTEKHFRNQKRREQAAIQNSHNCVSRASISRGDLKKTMRKDYFRGEVCAVKLTNQMAPFSLTNSQP